MRVGVLRETKDRELRVALLPGGARALSAAGHQVFVEADAGAASGFEDERYEQAGAKIVPGARELIRSCEVITKVKEPTASEIAEMEEGQTLFDFLHLAPEPDLTQKLLDRGVCAIGYETVALDDGSLPLLVPMSEVAGRLAVQIGAHLLQADQGGRGVLLGGVPGVPRGHVTVLGAGIVGTAAVRMATGLGAEVSVLDIDQRRLSHLYDIYHGSINTLYSNSVNVEQSVLRADIVVGAVLKPGERAPVLVSRALVSGMREGSVIMDVAVDQGGCIETIRPTSHSQPTYVEHGVIHYGVPNMPGAVPQTSTLALGNATFPYLKALCDEGVEAALAHHTPLARGVNCWRGQVVHPGVAAAQGRECAGNPWTE
ncbi:MAG: alanine dehydrogenase [Deltaproteobacteria bacterium]|nr:alanine dehydrogenase [Deltaproteobacteria bacterium]MBW2414552.1 alanine dehydrogenase [Deltaproteobacteria bacterium]